MKYFLFFALLIIPCCVLGILGDYFTILIVLGAGSLLLFVGLIVYRICTKKISLTSNTQKNNEQKDIYEEENSVDQEKFDEAVMYYQLNKQHKNKQK